MKFRMRHASLADKPRILEIAKTSQYTKGVSNPMFMPDSSFEKGWVGVAEVRSDDDVKIVGFVAVRHGTRNKFTSLYYVGVDPEWRSRGIGERIVEWVMEESPWNKIQLITEKTNERAAEFYKRIGFEVIDEGANKAGEEYFRYELYRRSD